MTEPAFRRATVNDAANMAQIVADWEQATDWMPAKTAVSEIEEFIRAALPNREIWVAGDPVAGYLSFDPAEQRVGGLYCQRGGSGLGKALMDKVKEGRYYIWLATHAANLKAQKFYAREGFVEVERYDPEPPLTVREIRMEWRS